MKMVEPTFFTQKHHRPALYFLTAVNALSLMMAISIVVVLNPEDRISNKRGSALTALGFVYFMTLFELLNIACLHTTLGARLRHKYTLSCGDVLDINNKVVSAVQAYFCCVTGAVVCGWSCTRDFMRSSHYMSDAYAWFGAAYFFYDIWSMYMVHVQMHGANYSSRKQRRPNGDVKKQPSASFLSYVRHEPVILFHHLFIGAFGFLVIVYFRGKLGDCTFGFVYLMELSTPFVSLRGILSRLKLKQSKAYIANGLAMLVTFFFCRVASLPYVMLLYSRTIELPYFEAVRTLPGGCQMSILILLLPQLYWFFLMSSGALKIFFAKPDKNANKVDNLSANLSANLTNSSSTKLSAGDAEKRS